MKSRIPLLFFLCCGYLQGMEKSHNDKTYLLSLEETEKFITLQLKSLSKNKLSDSKINLEINLPKKLPHTLYGIILQNFNNLSKLFSLAHIGIIGQKSKLLELACNYEYQLADLPSDSKIVAAYSRALWDNYFLLCPFESAAMNHAKLQKHLWWKTKRILSILEKTKSSKSIKLCRSEARYSFDLVLAFMHRAEALRAGNKPLRINETALNQEYRDLAHMFIKIMKPDEETKLTINHYISG